MVSINDARLNERHGGVTAPHAEKAYLGKFPEEQAINHSAHLLSVIFLITQEKEAEKAVDEHKKHNIDVKK